MARAKERKIILPDALPSPTKRPGPAERRLESYQALASALRTKELVSQWSLQSSEDATSELQLREALTRTLMEHSHFGYIRDASKLPQSHPKKDRGRIHYSLETESGITDFLRPNDTDWLGSETAPRSGNWSVIPKLGGRLMIFDLDVQKTEMLRDGTEGPTDRDARYAETRRAVEYLERVLGMDLRNTYAQLSPSGGVHIFLLLPEGVDPSELPAAKISDGMRSLAGIAQEDWSQELRGDIRSGASNGFILMAGSRLNSSGSKHYRPLVSDSRWSDFKDFRSGRKLRLLELTGDAVERLREARRIDLERKVTKATSKEVSVDDRSELIEPVVRERNLQVGNYARILQRLAAEPPRSFHEARAQIYRALSCCASPETIAEICRQAGYGRDRYRGRELSDSELLADMESMARRGLTATRCGSHCNSLWNEASGSREHRVELTELLAEIRSERLQGLELSSTAYRRAEESALLEARTTLRRRAQRGGDFGIYGKRKPRGLQYRAVLRETLGERAFSGRLRGESMKIAGYRMRALELVLGYFGPLFAAGAPVAIAPVEELTELFGWSKSQLREALRFLRSSEIIVLEHRQISGRSSTYGPGDKRFFDPRLSRKLRAAWGASKIENGAGEKAFLGGFFDHRRGRIVRPDGSSHTDGYLLEVGGGFSGLLRELQLEIPSFGRVAESVVGRYLTKAVAHYERVASADRIAQETLDELNLPIASAVQPIPVDDFVLPLVAMAETSRKDRAKDSPWHSIHRRELRRSRGDRSPPEDPEDCRPSETT